MKPQAPVAPRSSSMPFPELVNAAPRSSSSPVPNGVLARAEGDTRLEKLFEIFWVGPLPSFADAAWFQGVAAGHSSLRTRQAVVALFKKANSPVKRALPEIDPRSDESFARFMLDLMCIADGMEYVRGLLPGAVTKGSQRWIFNSFYESVHHRTRTPRRPGHDDTIVSALLPMLRKLHLAGQGDMARSYLILESLFMLRESKTTAEASLALVGEFGDDYVETAAFCGRVAAFSERQEEAAMMVAEYRELLQSDRSRARIPLAAMPDLDEVTRLDRIPGLAVPSKVDAIWIRDKIALSGAFRSHLHGNREAFNAVLGTPGFWPDDKPTSEALVARVERMFEAPQPLLGSVTRRAGDSMFRSFYRKVETILKTVDEALSERGQQASPSGEWDLEGDAPSVFRCLLEAGYRDYAADFAILRAIENPSLPLERETAAAGEDFEAISAFVRERRRASAWFEANDSDAGLEVFKAYLERFRAGERAPLGQPGSSAAAASMEPPSDPAMTHALPEFPSPHGTGRQLAIHLPHAVGSAASRQSAFDELAALLGAMSQSAADAAASLGARDVDAFDRQLNGMLALADRVRAEALSLPRGVSNAGLLRRAAAIGQEAVEIAETLGEDVHLPDLPPTAIIALADAEAGDKDLDAAQTAVATAQEAIREVAALTERTRMARLNEIGTINSQIASSVSKVQLGLADVIEALAAAVIRMAASGELPFAHRGPAISVDTVRDTASSTLGAAGPGAEVGLAMPDGMSGTAPSGSDDLSSPAAAETAASPSFPRELVSSSVDAALVGDASDVAFDDLASEDEAVEADLEALNRLIETTDREAAIDASWLPEEASEQADPDPEDVRIDEALASFMAAGSYALAYNLARAAEAEGRGDSLSTTSDEAKLAAIAGHLNHTALLSRADLVEEWVRAGLGLAEAIERDVDRERASARLLAAMPLMVELGIFFPAAGADEVLRRFTVLPGDLGERASEVFSSISRIRHTNVAFTRAMLANVASELDCADAMAKARQALLRKTEQFSIMKFDFQLGTKIRNEMNRSDGLMGRLRIQLAKGIDDARTVETLRDFVAKVPDRVRMVQLLDDAEEQINVRFKGIDGAARDRFVAFFTDFRDEANHYIELRAEIDSAKQAERPKAREFAKEIARALGGMIAAVEAAANDQGRLGVAAGHVAPRLRKVANILAGDPSVTIAPMVDVYHALHAEMAFVLELDFGRSWLPSPYDTGRIIDLLCGMVAPLVPRAAEDRDAYFEMSVYERMARGSYVGARMLLDAASFFGVSDELRASLGGELDVNLSTARQGLAEDVALARKGVERLIRFGSLRQGGAAESATSLLDRVDAIGAVQVPIAVSPEERSDTEDAGGIYDVSVAIDALEEIKASTQALYDEPRLRLLRRVDEMAASGTDPVLVDRLRVLCQHDDLLTAEEYIEDAAITGSIPESRNLNWRFAEFSQVVLPKLAQHRRDLSVAVVEALREGENFETIRFKALTEARRRESADIVSLWHDMFLRLNDQAMPALFSMFLDRVGIRAKMSEAIERDSDSRKMFVADFRVEFDTDQESLLLPDFGSRTEGWYRMAVLKNLPSDSVVESLCSSAKLGVIAFVCDTVPADQRRAFHLRNLEGKRRILLVDSASLFYALGEPALRALTLLELGQPYSFVAPYHDWGRDAVPPEMFVGRREDIGHIFDTEGSCIVYGGRRMGKTAILRHLRATRHDPLGGTLVAFVDAQEIGKGPTPTNRIWAEIVASLPEVFGRTAVSDGKRVRHEIKRWLEEDQRRRVLMLLDECDQFVVADAAQNYAEFRALQQLMTDTHRRFKFVLSGLSDVTRLVQTGNPPLKQISANPRRIGSLTGRERKDAEDLVVRPFAAIGVTMQRTDVWRILSHANYYPVLIQTYAEKLLQLIAEKSRQSQRPIREIGADLVSEVMDDHKVREEIKGIFQFTLGIDLRYRLIAYVVASLVFDAEAEGRIAEGFRVREIRDLALAYWEAGFQDRNRFSLFDDLLDEMEGLGIVRRVDTDLWTLRSSAVVRLLGNRDEIEDAIANFFDMEAPVGFDPKSHRRELAAARGLNAERKSSPLTLGQERDVLLSKARATVILGNRLADFALVPASIESAPSSISEGDGYEIRIVRPSSATDLEATIREQRLPTGKKLLLVVPATCPWTSKWVREVITARAVASGKLRVVFAGGPEHAASVLCDTQLSALTAHVSQVALEPWSTAYFGDRVNSSNSFALSQRFQEAVDANGGWNDPMWRLLKAAKSSQVEPETPDPETIGLTGRFGEAFRLLAGLHGDEPFTSADVDVYASMDDALAAVGVTGEALIEYGLFMGLLVISNARPQGEERRNRHVLSPLATRALGVQAPAPAE